jgi:hypothetical protein
MALPVRDHCGDFCDVHAQTPPAKPNVSNRGIGPFRARGKWLNSFVSFSLSQLPDPLTSNSGSAYRGSSPWGAAKLLSSIHAHLLQHPASAACPSTALCPHRVRK